MVTTARERAREADLLRFGLEEIEAVAPEPGEDTELAAEESRLGFADTLRSAAEQAREALSAEHGGPDALGATSAARTLLEASASTTPRPPSSPTGWRRSATCSPTWPPTSRPTPPASRPTRPGWPRVSERRAALTALTRKYGDTIDEVLAWSEQSARRLLELDHTDERLVELRELRTGLRAQLAEAAAALSEARTATAAGSARRSPPSWACWRCRTPGSASRSASTRPRRPPTTRPPARRCRWGSGGCASRPPASTTSSSCWPPTPAPTPAHSTRAPPAVSCPG